MEGKDSFILYTKYINIFKVLSMDQRGVLITHIFEYVNDEIPESEEDNIKDATTKVAWLAIKTDLKEDLVKWKDTCKKRSDAGKLGGRPKKVEEPKKAKKPNANFALNEKSKKKQTKAKKADSEYDCDCEYEYDLNNNILSSKHDEVIKKIIDYLNQKTGGHFRADAESNKRLIRARINEGRSFEDFKHVIDVKCEQWLGFEQEKYLRPETLFNASHFESYLNEKLSSNVKNNPLYLPNGGFDEL